MTNIHPDIILLDMDNTIYEYAPCHTAALQEAAEAAYENLSIRSDDFKHYYENARQEIHRRLHNTAASHNRLLYFQRLLELGGHGVKPGLALRLYEIYWEAFIKNIKIFEGVYEFLDCAKQADIPVALVTDLTADIQFKKIERLCLEKFIAAVVTSEEAGAEKPAPDIFILAVEKMARAAKTVWMIGDSLKKDIAGGKAIGAVTFLKVHGDTAADTSETKPDMVFHSFTELTDILKKHQSCGR